MEGFEWTKFLFVRLITFRLTEWDDPLAVWRFVRG